MAGPDYGASSGNYEDTLRRMYEGAAQAADELNRKEQEVAQTEERTTGVEERAKTTRTGLAGATRELSSALSANLDRLAAETAVVRENTAALERNLATRRAIVESGGAPPSYVATGGHAAPATPAYEPVAVAGGGGGGRRPPRRPVAAAGGFEEDPNAVERLNSSRRQLAEAELAAAQARRNATQQVAAAARGERVELTATEQLAAARTEAASLTTAQLRTLRSLGTPQEQAPVGAGLRNLRALEAQGLVQSGARGYAPTAAGQRAVEAAAGPIIDPTAAVEQREATRQQAQLARQAVRDAERQIALNQQINQSKAQQAEADKAASEASLRAAQTVQATAREEEAARAAAAQALEAQAVAGARQLGGPVPGRLALPPAGGTFGAPVGGVSSSGAALSEKELAQMENYRRLAATNAESLSTLTTRRAAANQELQREGALYADVSTRLTRHGALTSEFITALAQGQVTMREFSGQMVQTIGKFSGWAVAGAAVYGVYGLFKNLVEGATETQAAIQNLGRFIPGLGGPAGGGNARIPQAEDQLRALSTQFNVPISQVADVQQVAARRFPTVKGSATVTQAILAAERLDQIPVQQGEQYILGIGSALNLQPQGIVRVVNQLNALQSSFGARVAQTLPAFARAAPVARAEGLGQDQLAALVALGVRSGIPGAQVGTALLRSAGTFAFRPQNQINLRALGITPQPGEVGQLYSDVFKLIGRGRTADGRPLVGGDIVRLAQALGGPLLGTRTILPILEQQALRPGSYERALGIAQRPRPYQEDLNAVLGSVAERFKSIGIALQNFGSVLAQMGALAPLTGLLDGIRFVTQSITRLAQPIADVVGQFNRLPGVVRDAIGVFVAFRALRALSNTRFGGDAQSFISRFPGLADVRNSEREVVTGTANRLDRELLPLQRNDTERAAQAMVRAQKSYASALDEQAAFTERNGVLASRATTEAGRRDPAVQSYLEQAGAHDDRVDSLSKKAATTQQEYNEQALRLATMEGQLAILKDGEVGWEQRANFAAQQGYVAAQQTVELREQVNAQLRAQLAEAEGATGALAAGGRSTGSLAGAGEVAAAGTLAGAVGVAADAFANNTSSVRTVTDAVQREMAQGSGVYGPLTQEQAKAQTQARAQAQRDAAAQRLQAAAQGPAGSRTFYGGSGPPSEELAPLTLSQRAQRTRAWLASRGISPGGEEGGAIPPEVTNRLASFGKRLGGIVSGPQAPFAGLLASQLVGSAIGGGVGSYIQSVGGEAATGAIIAQMLGKGGAPAVVAGAGVGVLAGSFQQGTGTGLAATGGAIIGGAVGSLSGPLGAAVGATVGATVGSTVGAIFNHPKSQQDIANAAQRQVRRSLQVYSPGELQSRTAAEINSAFTGGGQTQQASQAKLSALENRLTSETQLFGDGSAPGRAARTSLNALVGAAVSQAGTDPATALQVTQAASQARNQVITQHFQYGLSRATTPGAAIGASNEAISRIAQIQQPYDDAVKSAQTGLIADRLALIDVLGTGKKGAISLAQQKVQQDQQQLDAARSVAGIARASGTLQEASAATAAFQQVVTQIQSQTALAQAQAGGNQLQSLAVQRGGVASEIAKLRGDTRFQRKAPEAYAEQLRGLRTQQTQLGTQTAQQQLQEVQAQGALLVSTAPIGDTVAQARLSVQSLQSQLSFMRANRGAFDKGQFAQLQANLNDAQKAVTQAISDRATQMAQLAGQLASAQDFGNAMAQANDSLRAAERQLAVAITPTQRQTARVNIAQAHQQQYQAGQQRIQSEGQLQQALDTGNTVAQAQVGLRTAQSLVSSAHGIDNQIAAEAALAQAQAQYRQALEQRYISLGQLAASTTSNPLTQLQDQMRAIVRALGVARGVDERTQLQTQLNNLKLQYQSTLIGQRESTTDFQLQMYQITYAQAISQLESLLKVKDITLQQRQQIQLKIRQLEQTDTGGGQFDLAPDLAQHLKLPTPYDVARAIHTANREFSSRLSDGYRQGLAEAGGAHAGGGTGPHSYHSADTYNFTVNVEKGAEVTKVIDTLERATGSTLQARLRAGGHRGT